MAGKSKRAFEVGRANLWMFDPSQLHLVSDPGDPLYDARIKLPLDEALVLNIMAQGILEPVVIVKREGNPTVVAGRQRVRAALEANKRLQGNGHMPVRVPCVLRSDDRACLGVMISENELRQDDGPLQKAKKAQQLLGIGYTEDEISVLFGVTKTSVRNWLQLAESPEEVRKLVETGEINTTTARKIRKLPKVQQVAAVAKAKAAKKTQPRKGPKAKRAAAVTTKDVETAAGADLPPAQPRMRNRAEIEARLGEKNIDPTYASALRWVLRLE